MLELRGNVNIALLLIENAKDKKQAIEKAVNSKNSSGETVLHLAAQQGNIEIFNKYLNYYLDTPKENINVTDKAGYTPLYWSKLLGHTEISDILTKCAIEYTKITKTEHFKDLPPVPKIALSYNSEVGGITPNAARDRLVHQYGDVENIDYRRIVPESKNINEEIINEVKQKAKELLADKDALVIPGNSKAVTPEIARQFGGEVVLEESESDFARSLAEMVMVEVAIEKGMPIMGICGGHQVINTYLKGKITGVHDGDHTHDSIIIEPTSELASMIKINPDTKEVPNQSFWAAHGDIVQK